MGSTICKTPAQWSEADNACAVPASYQPVSAYYSQPGTGDRGGGDVGGTTTPHATSGGTLQACFDTCDKLTGCGGVSYDSNTKRCAPKDNHCAAGSNDGTGDYIKYNRMCATSTRWSNAQKACVST